MLISKFCSIVLLGTAAAMACPVYAQQAAEPAKAVQTAQSSTPAADTTASDNAEAAATAAAIAKANAAAAAAAAGKPPAKLLDAAKIAKKAKQTGWRPEVQNGNTVYCRNDPEVGSRFSTRRCVSEIQLANLIEQAEFDKDQLKQRGCSGNCGGK
ncbi:MAG TPA: hypothetical protein VGI90_08810 [Steroidobacteraceae bacterium]